MIEKNTVHLNYIKKEPQSGSYCGMRYMLVKAKDEAGEDCIKVTIWPEPLCFVKTPPELKQHMLFPLTAEGTEDAVDWMNEQYEAQKDRWNP